MKQVIFHSRGTLTIILSVTFTSLTSSFKVPSEQLVQVNTSSLDEKAASLVTRLLDFHGARPKFSEIMDIGAQKIDLSAASSNVLAKPLPEDVAVIVKASAIREQDRELHQRSAHRLRHEHSHVKEVHEHQQQKPFDERSLAKARVVLSEMVLKSQKELDEKIIECQTFKEANRGTFDQLSTDLARMGNQIAAGEGQKLSAANGISTVISQLDQEQDLFSKQKAEFLRSKKEDQHEMKMKMDDLAVFQFVLVLTKCGETALLQEDGNSSNSTAPLSHAQNLTSHPKICEYHDGHQLHWDDPGLQKKYEKMLTPVAKAEVQRVLAEIGEAEAEVAEATQFLQQIPQQPPAAGPIKEGKRDDQFSCPPTPPDCGLLHDKMALLWGGYKDMVDELQHEMDIKQQEFDAISANYLATTRGLNNAQNAHAGKLAEATSNLNADRDEQTNMETKKQRVQSQYEEMMDSCRDRISWILFQDICATVVIRNAILQDSTVCSTDALVDCDVEDWVPEECSVSCDDNCPDPNDPFGCGGWQTLKRRIIVSPNKCGIQCPALTHTKKCSQIKCPVDCEMSEWSEYSKCTKDCEGGVQQRTRTIDVPSANGGAWCAAPSESRACNTGSCDRDCKLADWTVWSSCSSACDGGTQERTRQVTVPTRGGGKCPKEDSHMRKQAQDCNAQDCAGDEICIAKQDLVIAIDGSGSLTEEGFAILQQWTSNLIAKYQGEYYASDAVQIGIVQFGNGEIKEDGTVSSAVKVMPLSTDTQAAQEAVMGLPFSKGFTNMAQAFALAEVMFTEKGRTDAQSAVMIISDGKPSFLFQTRQKVDDLSEKGIQRYMVVVTEESGDSNEMVNMRSYASDPWHSNFVHIPGIYAMQGGNGTFVQECLVKFCPKAISPKNVNKLIESNGFMLVAENGKCGGDGTLLMKDATNPAQCAEMAKEKGYKAFTFGSGSFFAGTCSGIKIDVKHEIYDEWKHEKVTPACPFNENGEIEPSYGFDFYAIEPVYKIEIGKIMDAVSDWLS